MAGPIMPVYAPGPVSPVRELALILSEADAGAALGRFGPSCVAPTAVAA